MLGNETVTVKSKPGPPFMELTFGCREATISNKPTIEERG
jgi:hypothetical protein